MATNVTKGTRLSKPRDDMSVNFVLRGGPQSGLVVRLYPDLSNPDDPHSERIWTPIRIDGALYVPPLRQDQSDTKPYYMHKKEA